MFNQTRTPKRGYLKAYQILHTFRTWDVDNPYGYVILYNEETGEKMAIKSDINFPYFFNGELMEISQKEMQEMFSANQTNLEAMSVAIKELTGHEA
jgi:hypothetical protein